MLLILSETSDSTIQLVLPLLEERGVEFLWIDTGEFPEHLQMDISYPGEAAPTVTLRSRDRVTDLAGIRTVWDRRPGKPKIPHEVTEPTQRAYMELQCQEFLVSRSPACPASGRQQDRQPGARRQNGFCDAPHIDHQ